MSKVKKVFPAIVFLGILLCVIIFMPPPASWTQASIFQILEFFIPLLFFITFLINIFLDFFPKSFCIGLGGMMLVTLESVGQLNIVTGGIDIIATVLLATSFKKPPLRETRAVDPKKERLKNI